MVETKRRLTAVMLLGVLVLAACSPEATRSRSGGPGGDIGNRTSDVDLHGQRNPYYRTPAVGVQRQR